jgi:hypothetical protein
VLLAIDLFGLLNVSVGHMLAARLSAQTKFLFAVILTEYAPMFNHRFVGWDKRNFPRQVHRERSIG